MLDVLQPAQAYVMSAKTLVGGDSAAALWNRLTSSDQERWYDHDYVASKLFDSLQEGGVIKLTKEEFLDLVERIWWHGKED